MAVQYAFGKIITQGLDLNVDAADPTSYPGTGTSWTSVVNRSITGSLVSCSYSTDFKGGIVFNNPSASVQFPGTVANYGTGSFTIEMAFRPSSINGIHYLASKNSGSFPNWGVYLSGSGGSGKLFAEYRINASVSCSVSSSTVFETGSNYFVDTVFSPLDRRVYINIDGEVSITLPIGNGSGSLTNTGSFLVGNTAPSSSQAYSGSIFNTKVYSTFNSGFVNYRTMAQRIQKVPSTNPREALTLIVGGGGGGGGSIGGGGGAGGFIYTTIPLISKTYTVNVGNGGNTSTNGQNSYIDTIIAYGGGAGGQYSNDPGNNGGSGGGGSAKDSPPGTIASGSAIYGNQGNNGAVGLAYNGSGGGGGGGGAFTPGFTGSGAIGGKGGEGLPLTISGVLGYYAGGGGGAGGISTDNGGTGGIGGGGNGGGFGGGTNGTPNTGGGGGASGGTGGSGIVIIRYNGSPIGTGGTISQVGGDTIHTFAATGSSTFTVF
jgi:hypothetical protein